ncbi:hypothetical protein PHYPSEUDO_001774, partial [Phytophthora pseudosyringae]
MGFFSPDTITNFVRRGDLEGVRRRIELGDDVNERRSFQCTPLTEAAKYNLCAITNLLLDHGADMDLTNMNGFTALHMAVYDKNIEAALLLTRRGANVNRFGYMGQTPLQCAVNGDLIEVTAELLRHGADPAICNKYNYCARDYVPLGSNQEKFLKLLTAYVDLESAIKAKNADAITVWLRKALTGDPSSAISDIDAAIQLQHADAVAAVLEITLATRTLDDQVQKHKSVEAGIESAVDVNWRESLTLAGDDYKKNWLKQVLLSQDMGGLRTFTEALAKDAWMQQVVFNNGWTPLHYSASLDNLSFVQYLLVECGLNPLALSSDKKTARDVAIEAESSSDLCWMLQQHMKKRAFSDQSALLLSSEVVTVSALQQLPRQMTSVYDLRIVYNLAFEALAPAEMHDVLTEAFDAVIREKLVFDDHAAVFFKMGLQECRRHNFISEVEQIKWDVKATKVNVENSDWVREIKQTLQAVESRVTTTERNVQLLHSQFGALRNALVQREQFEIKQRKRQRYISLLSSALLMCGGGILQDVVRDAFSLSDPEQLMSALSAGHMKEFLAETTTTLVFKDGVEALLREADVDPAEFAEVLRDAISQKHFEAITLDETAVVPHFDTEDENPLFPPKNENPLFPPKNENPRSPPKKTGAFRAAVHAALQSAKAKEDEEKLALFDAQKAVTSPATTVQTSSPTSTPIASQMSEEDMAAYPYHYAVRFSEGNFELFQEMVQYVEEEDDDINQTLSMYVRPADFKNPTEVVEASALVYASYLGHVETVKWFLDRNDVVKSEKSVLTIKRSRSSLADGNE